ncbi:MAG: SDR family oxidoreductase [Ruminococcus sp.]|nr:SDR family oxidoreductase [Ruminococcus sp.]
MLKTAVVTGASRGIGAAVTRELAAQGYQVAGIYQRSDAAMQVLSQECGVIPFAADLGNPDAIAPLTEQLLARMGHINLLVHNAGISCHGLFQTISPEQSRRLYAVNVTAVIELTRALLPVMLARHSGNIICIASMWGEVGASCEVDYSVTKGALLAFVKALAKEVGPSGIRVNAVSPGTIQTDMTAVLGTQTLEALAEETALCRLGTPEEVAHAVCFLASERAAYITGQDLAVNGGLL